MEDDGVVLVVRSFATLTECAELRWWTHQSVEIGQFEDGISKDSSGNITRVSSRLSNRLSGERITYPPLVYKIQSRISELLNLRCFSLIEGHGKDGIVCSVTYNGGDVYEHTDPPVKFGFCGLRCNLLVQAPTTGGDVIIADKRYKFNTGDLHCYKVTEYKHRVETCRGEPRILFMFGWCVPKD